jgi:predicted transcriptional regulator
MAQQEKAVRQSVTLPSPVAKRVQALAKKENRSSSRVLVDLIEAGLDAREQQKKTFFELADRLAASSDTSEQKRLKRELARLTYGE